MYVPLRGPLNQTAGGRLIANKFRHIPVANSAWKGKGARKVPPQARTGLVVACKSAARGEARGAWRGAGPCRAHCCAHTHRAPYMSSLLGSGLACPRASLYRGLPRRPSLAPRNDMAPCRSYGRPARGWRGPRRVSERCCTCPRGAPGQGLAARAREPVATASCHTHGWP